ncbi:serine O-acetyltransferase [Klenkia soli]|uniref:Serine O-acetyltransferase n=1 Tax=Klenkia soli TaxID=1052260 RepID=A0A1H0JJY2_9ACTN|nr:DapH/DapD/GlmU-related protein [Klenkia soli]SDO43691.1 serine O-acetyltransferase [Klenkia soli]
MTSRVAVWAGVLLTSPLWAVVERAEAGPYLRRDAERFVDCLPRPGWAVLSPRARFGQLVLHHPEFRSVVHYRLAPLPAVLRWLLRRAYPPLPTLHIGAPHVGPGLFVEHGFATVLTASSVGADCWVNQGVTVGHTGRGQPVIGDRVRLGAGAVVVGPVRVGDGAVVGAGAVVRTDVAAGAVVVPPEAVRLDGRGPAGAR